MADESVNTSYSPALLASRPAWAQNLLKALLLLACLCALIFSVNFGVTYFTTYKTISVVDEWFDERKIPADGDIVAVLSQLQQADTQLGSDADVKLALARLYILLAQHHNTAGYLDAARQLVTEVKLLQPSHYVASSLTVLLDDLQHEPAVETHNNFRQALQLGSFEKSAQMIVGPLIVKHWLHLPEDIHHQSGPMIKSMLSEQEARDKLISVMQEVQLFAPFAKFSPNRKTTEELRMMDARNDSRAAG